MFSAILLALITADNSRAIDNPSNPAGKSFGLNGKLKSQNQRARLESEKAARDANKIAKDLKLIKFKDVSNLNDLQLNGEQKKLAKSTKDLNKKQAVMLKGIEIVRKGPQEIQYKLINQIKTALEKVTNVKKSVEIRLKDVNVELSNRRHAKKKYMSQSTASARPIPTPKEPINKGPKKLPKKLQAKDKNARPTPDTFSRFKKEALIKPKLKSPTSPEGKTSINRFPNNVLPTERNSPPLPSGEADNHETSELIPPQFCQINANQVAIFPLYTNYCQILNQGNYASYDQYGGPRIRSARVGSGVQATICTKENFLGKCVTYKRDFELFDKIGVVKTTQLFSMKIEPRVINAADCIPGPNQVALFEDSNWVGKCVVHNVGSYGNKSEIGLKGDSISSIRLGSNAWLHAYIDSNFRGSNKVFRASEIYLHSAALWGNSISSIKVLKNGLMHQGVPPPQVASPPENETAISKIPRNVLSLEGDSPPQRALPPENETTRSRIPRNVLSLGEDSPPQRTSTLENESARSRIPKNVLALGGDSPPQRNLSTEEKKDIQCREYAVPTHEPNGTIINGAGFTVEAYCSENITFCYNPAPNEVAFKNNLGAGNGDCRIKTVGRYSKSHSIVGSRVISIRMGHTVQVRICTEENFQGKCVTYKHDIVLSNSYGVVKRGSVRSAKVEPRVINAADCIPGPNQVAFFQDSSWVGTCVVRNVGNYGNKNEIGLKGDSISSFRLGSNAKIRVFEHNNFEGRNKVFQESEIYLNPHRTCGYNPFHPDCILANDEWGNTISSINVMRK
jgi:hypothetical protein